jgi:hypothetical protein
VARLIGYGLTIESELPVPGAVAPASANPRAPDLCIRWEPLADADASRPPGFARAEDGLICFVPGVALYRCRRDCIGVAPLAGSDPADVAALLVASALPAALWMRGAFVLHAAAACWPGGAGALAIVGRSGAGKSTIVEQLMELGALLVGDDSLAIEAGAEPPLARGLAGAIRSARAEGGATFCAVAPQRSCLVAPLAAVLVLAEADGTWSIDRVGGVASVEQLLAHRHRPRAALLAGRAGEALRDGVRLGARVPVHVWRRPRGRPHLHPDESAMLTEWLTHGRASPPPVGRAANAGSAAPVDCRRSSPVD